MKRSAHCRLRVIASGTVPRPVVQSLLAIALLIASTFSAEAAMTTFDFLTGPLTLSPNSISMTQDGVSVTATAYQVEFSEDSTTIYGPFTTGSGMISNQVFGTCVSGICNTGLALGSWQDLGQTDFDRGSAVASPGFDNSSLPLSSNPSLQFALFSFSRPVDLSEVIVDDVSNYSRGIWVAAGNMPPDLSSDLVTAFSEYTVVNSPDDSPGDGVLIHTFDTLLNVTYIAVGTPTRATVGDIGPFQQGPNTQFYINGLTVSPVPGICEGDFQPDGSVNEEDLAIFAEDFGRIDCIGDCEGDFDTDNDVDGIDLAGFAADFGRTDCP